MYIYVYRYIPYVVWKNLENAIFQNRFLCNTEIFSYVFVVIIVILFQIIIKTCIKSMLKLFHKHKYVHN